MDNKNNLYLTCDIGGTDIKYGVIDINNNFIIKNSVPTKSAEGGKAIMSQIRNIFKDLSVDYKLNGVSISTAGVVDTNTFKVVDGTYTIKDYIGLNINDELKSLNVPISVENDVNSAALAEITLGSGKDFNNAVVMTIGTGIGGAIIIDKHLYRGGAFSAGEWGNMIIKDNTAFEKLAATKILVDKSKNIYNNIKNGVDVFNLYDKGDLKIINLVNNFYDNLSIGISNIIYSLNPEILIIGGGITGRGDKFLDELTPFIQKRISSYMFKNTKISVAHFKNDAGMIGAFENFKLKYKKN